MTRTNKQNHSITLSLSPLTDDSNLCVREATLGDTSHHFIISASASGVLTKEGKGTCSRTTGNGRYYGAFMIPPFP